MLCGVNREDVVHAALIVERWCAEHYQEMGGCDCPLHDNECLIDSVCPISWGLEPKLRTRGLKHD